MDPFYLQVGMFLLTIFGTAILTTWRVGRALDARDSVSISLINAHEQKDAERFASVHGDIETVRHDFGETGAALRQRMHEMEMWGRDNNLSKRTFEIVTGEIKESIKTVSEKVDNVISRNAGIDQGRQR